MPNRAPFLLVESFKIYKERILEIEHYGDCQYANRSIPVSECPCTCYEMKIFSLGMSEKEKQFYGGKKCQKSPKNPKKKSTTGLRLHSRSGIPTKTC